MFNVVSSSSFSFNNWILFGNKRFSKGRQEKTFYMASYFFSHECYLSRPFSNRFYSMVREGNRRSRENFFCFFSAGILDRFLFYFIFYFHHFGRSLFSKRQIPFNSNRNFFFNFIYLPFKMYVSFIDRTYMKKQNGKL